MLARLEQATGFSRRLASSIVLVSALLFWSSPRVIARVRGTASTDTATAPGQQRVRDTSTPDRDQLDRTHREEGEAILALADAAMAGKSVPRDFPVEWQNDFVKAQRGTFVPFTLTVDRSRFTRPSALVYVRATRRGNDERGRRLPDAYPVDAIFPVEFGTLSGGPFRFSRGFSVPSGEYDVFVVMRERVDPDGSRSQPKAAVMRQQLSVPEFWSGELTTSSIIVADRLTTLVEDVAPEQLAERPYVIGRLEVTPAADRRFRKDEELVVVFLVYHPMVTAERQFDIKVEYHFFRKGEGPGGGREPAESELTHPPVRPGERYFNHTDPQRFNPALMGSTFNPANGEPVMAGQIVPLAGFEIGEYRLDVQVMDLLSGKSLSRDVSFTVAER
jgi:hypothetical protein